MNFDDKTYSPEAGHNVGGNAQPASMGSDFSINQVLGGRYRLLDILGKGGMGIVYRVEQIFLKKEFALKTIDKQFLSDVSIKRFEHEARASFAVDHPNVISVKDFGLLDERTPFLVMEIVKGKTLANLIKEKGFLSVDEAIPIFAQTCLGLAHAHENGVVHRDIKPSNIMILDDRLDDGSYVKILDFGIAKIAGGEHENIQALTKTGDVFGSPLYMSPEQCSAAKIDHRSDIYSLGCVFFECLTGTPPFVGENALMTMMQHQTAEIPTLREASLGKEFPKKLEELVRTMLAKRPEERWQNLGLVAIDLAALRTDKPLIVKEDHTFTALKPVKEVRKPEEITLQPVNFALILVAVALTSAFLTASVIIILSPSRLIRPANLMPAGKPVPVEVKQVEASREFLSNLFAPAIKSGTNRFEAKGFVSDETLKAFEGYEHAQNVNLVSCDVTDAGIKCFNKSKLLDLTVRDCDISTVENICQQKNLQKLDVSGTKIGDEALSKFAQLKNLDTLSLLRCENLSPSGLLALRASKSLQWVYLPSEVPPSIIEQLRNGLPQAFFPEYTKLTKNAEMELKFHKLPEFERLERVFKASNAANPSNFGALTYLARMYGYLLTHKRVEEGLKVALQTVKYVENSGSDFLIGESLRQLTSYSSIKGKSKEANAYNARAFALYRDNHYHDTDAFISTLQSFLSAPLAVNDYAMMISVCELGIDCLKRFPNTSREYLPIYLERIGWCYIVSGKREKGLPYLEENLAAIRAQKELNEPLYARGIIELAHCEFDFARREKLYLEGIALIDKLKCPDVVNLPEHYSDATTSLSGIYAAQNKPHDAIKYALKGIALLESMAGRPGGKARISALRKILSEELEKTGQKKEAQAVRRKMN